MNSLWKLLLYLTNNEKSSRHEEIFDVIFFAIATAGLTFGIYLMIERRIEEWIPILVIEYIWAWDNIRHNRP